MFWNLCQQMFKIFIWFQIVCFGCFCNTVDDRWILSTSDRIDQLPVFSPNTESTGKIKVPGTLRNHRSTKDTELLKDLFEKLGFQRKDLKTVYFNVDTEYRCLQQQQMWNECTGSIWYRYWGRRYRCYRYSYCSLDNSLGLRKSMVLCLMKRGNRGIILLLIDFDNRRFILWNE